MSPLIYEAARRYLLEPGPRRPKPLAAARDYLTEVHRIPTPTPTESRTA